MAIVFCVLSAQTVSADDSNDIYKLDWLAGEWIGEGRGGDDGDIEGVARQFWTPPLEGSISFFFNWHAEESAHVHYAITVFRQTADGIVGKGIHHGPDFEHYEEHPWQLKVELITDNRVQFECYMHCQADSLSFTLQDDGILEERWIHNPEENRADWIVRYRRPD